MAARVIKLIPQARSRIARTAERPCDCSSKAIQSNTKELIMAIDPVCGMEVDERTTKDKATHEGTTYYFCSQDCKEEFEASPEDYIGGDEQMTGT
jgi:YHS domain-containing protein